MTWTYSVSTLEIPVRRVATGLDLTRALSLAVGYAQLNNVGTAVHREGSGRLVGWYHGGTGKAARVLR